MLTADQVVRGLLVLQQMTEFRPNQPAYHYDGRVLNWGENLPPGCLESMRDKSEVVLLNGADGQPWAYLSCDAYGTIRQRLVDDSPSPFEAHGHSSTR